MSGDPCRTVPRPRRCLAFCAVALLGALLPAGSAPAARPTGAAHSKPPRRVEVEPVGLSAPVGGRPPLRVPIRYPIQLAGQPLEVSVSLRQPGKGTVYTWNLGERAN